MTVELGRTVQNADLVVQSVQTASMSFVSTDADGRPLRSPNVNVRKVGSELPVSIGISNPRADGTFSIDGLAPGEYQVMVSAPTTRGQGWRATMQVAMARVVLNGEDVKDIRLMAAPMVPATGRLIVDSHAAGSPPSPLYVDASSPDPFEFWPYGGEPVNADSTFELHVPPARAVLSVYRLPVPWMVKSVRVQGVDVTDAGIDFSSGAPVRDIDIELTDRPPTVSGVVREPGGKVLDDYIVVLFPQERERRNVNAAISNARYFATARPDQDGRFIVRTLPPGDYYAIAVAYLDPSEIPDPEILRRLEDAAVPFSLGDAEAKTLDLKLHQIR